MGPMCGRVWRQGGGGARAGVKGLDVNGLLLLGRGPEVWGPQRGRSGWSPPDRKTQRRS